MLISNYCVNYYKDGFIYRFYVLADNGPDAVREFRKVNKDAFIQSIMPCNRYRIER